MISGFLIVSCSTRPQPISYGEDLCSYCRMSIVDARYGAELVTDKGKVYKFDALECLINHQQDNPEEVYAHVLVTDVTEPGQLTDARACTYLISPNIPSPMGANLSSFGSRATAESWLAQHEGILLDFGQLAPHLKANGFVR